ncbi:MAG: phosphoglucosamine mutase, partial [Bilifractor sp.]
ALGNTGRILVRESGTEPLIRVMAEAATEEECDKYTEDICRVIRERGFAVE